LAPGDLSGAGYAESIDEIGKAVALDPLVPNGQLNWGVALMRENRPEEAIVHYRESLKNSPDGVPALTNLCAALAGLNRLDEASSDCERALLLDANDRDGHLNLGVILAKQGRLDDAVTQFRAALALDPGLQKARDDLGLALRLQAARRAP
jgi:tetratricopeptide (TPR) repeat protein